MNEFDLLENPTDERLTAIRQRGQKRLQVRKVASIFGFAVVLIGAAAVAGRVLSKPAQRVEIGGQGLGSSGPTSALSVFSVGGLSFSYPSTWRTATYPADQATSSQEIMVGGTQVMHDPCQSVTGPSASAKECAPWPIDQLETNGILIEWRHGASLGWSLAGEPGSAITVGGLPARMDIQQPGRCSSIGANETITVTVAIPDSPSNYYAFTACMEGPDLAQGQSQVQALLSSTKWGPQ